MTGQVPASPQLQNETEHRFAAYLESRTLEWDHEALVGDNRPDFSVHWAGQRVICEAHEPRFELPNRVGAFDPYSVLRRSIRKKRRQGAGARADGLPYVLVVSDVGADIVFDERNVPGAMFGDASITLRVAVGPYPAEQRGESRLVAGRGGQLQHSTNTRFSAVCVIREFNPTTAAVERMLPPVDLPAPPTLERVTARLVDGFAAFERAVAEGVYDPDATATRLLVFHNPYAGAALPPDLFAGPYDQIFGLVNDEGGYGLVAEGVRSLEVPGR